MAEAARNRSPVRLVTIHTRLHRRLALFPQHIAVGHMAMTGCATLLSGSMRTVAEENKIRQQIDPSPQNLFLRLGVLEERTKLCFRAVTALMAIHAVRRLGNSRLLAIRHRVAYLALQSQFAMALMTELDRLFDGLGRGRLRGLFFVRQGSQRQ